MHSLWGSIVDNHRQSVQSWLGHLHARSAGNEHDTGGGGAMLDPAAGDLHAQLPLPGWCEDSAALACCRCGTAFTMLLRRHHCRACGEVFCNKCLTLKPLPQFGLAGPEKVCLACAVPRVLRCPPLPTQGGEVGIVAHNALPECVQGRGRELVLQVGELRSCAEAHYAPPVVAGADSVPTEGGALCISGAEFGNSAAKVSVSVGGVPCPAPTLLLPHRMLSVQAPPGAGARVAAELCVDGQSARFCVSYHAPQVDALTAMLHSGGMVRIEGDNFGAHPALITVHLDGVPLRPADVWLVEPHGVLRCRVPPRAVGGCIGVLAHWRDGSDTAAQLRQPAVLRVTVAGQSCDAALRYLPPADPRPPPPLPPPRDMPSVQAIVRAVRQSRAVFATPLEPVAPSPAPHGSADAAGDDGGGSGSHGSAAGATRVGGTADAAATANGGFAAAAASAAAAALPVAESALPSVAQAPSSVADAAAAAASPVDGAAGSDAQSAARGAAGAEARTALRRTYSALVAPGAGERTFAGAQLQRTGRSRSTVLGGATGVELAVDEEMATRLAQRAGARAAQPSRGLFGVFRRARAQPQLDAGVRYVVPEDGHGSADEAVEGVVEWEEEAAGEAQAAAALLDALPHALPPAAALRSRSYSARPPSAAASAAAGRWAPAAAVPSRYSSEGAARPARTSSGGEDALCQACLRLPALQGGLFCVGCVEPVLRGTVQSFLSSLSTSAGVLDDRELRLYVIMMRSALGAALARRHPG